MLDIIHTLFKGKNRPTHPNDDLAKEYNKTRAPKNHKTFCFAPSVNMYFAQDGRVKVCCNNFHYTIGRYPEQSIKEIWNSAAATELRDRLKNYDLSAGCKTCESDFQASKFTEVRARHFDNLPVDPHYPTMMEFVLTNVCNLECVMCRGENSSLIRQNREKLPPIHNFYDEAFIDQLAEFIPSLRETRFSGSGEAFSIDMNYEIWDMILDQNPTCLIMVQTNGTILNGRVKDLLTRGNFEIGVSLDSLQKEIYEAIRINARYESVMENILYLSDYSKSKNKKFTISTCVMRQNWRELPDFVLFCNKIGAVIQFHKVWAPQEYALFNLPADELQKIYSYWAGVDFPEDTPLQKQNKEHYKYYTSVVHQWMQQAPKIETASALVTKMSAKELHDFVIRQVEDHINNSTSTDSEKNTDIQLCTQKIEDVLLRCNAQITPAKLLRWMASLNNSQELVGGLKWESTDFIWAEAERILIIR